MTRCLNCTKLDLQANPKHAKVGLGHCTSMPLEYFVSFGHRVCERFKQAPEEIVEKRISFEKSLTTKGE